MKGGLGAECSHPSSPHALQVVELQRLARAGPPGIGGARSLTYLLLTIIISVVLGLAVYGGPVWAIS